MNKLLLFTFLFISCGINAQNPEIKDAAYALKYEPRADDKIKMDFPFDIPLRDAKGNLTNSAKVLANGEKPTIVFFWMTTCGPCRMEMAAIKEKYANWLKEADFKMVGISIDFPERHEAFKKLADTEGWQWDVYHDWSREFTAVMPGNLNGVPQVFVFDTQGKIIYHHRKYIPGDEDELFQSVKNLVSR